MFNWLRFDIAVLTELSGASVKFFYSSLSSKITQIELHSNFNGNSNLL